MRIRALTLLLTAGGDFHLALGGEAVWPEAISLSEVVNWCHIEDCSSSHSTSIYESWFDGPL